MSRDEEHTTAASEGPPVTLEGIEAAVAAFVGKWQGLQGIRLIASKCQIKGKPMMLVHPDDFEGIKAALEAGGER